MRKRWHQCMALCMAGLLASATLQVLPPGLRALAYAQEKKIPLNDAVKKSYLDLFEFAQEPQYSAAEINSMRDNLKRGQDMCVSSFKQKSSQHGKEIDQAQKQL